MIDEITVVIHKLGLRWKAGKLKDVPGRKKNKEKVQTGPECLLAGALRRGEKEIVTIKTAKGTLPIEYVDKLEVLGTLVTADNDDRATLNHRQNKAEKLYWKNSRKFKGKGLAEAKMDAWNQTSGNVAMYGLGGIALSTDLLRCQQTWENKMLRRIFNRKWGSTIQEYRGESAHYFNKSGREWDKAGLTSSIA